MQVLPLALNTVLALALGVVIGAAFFGPPPARRAPPLVVATLTVFGLVGWIAGLAGIYLRMPHSGAALTLGILGLCAARWLARGPAGSDDGGSALEPPDDGPPSPEWADFDRMRREWARSRDRVA